MHYSLLRRLSPFPCFVLFASQAGLTVILLSKSENIFIKMKHRFIYI